MKAEEFLRGHAAAAWDAADMSATVADVALRAEAAADTSAIGALLEATFGGTAEAVLVERLRISGEMVLALVAIASARCRG